MAIESSDLDTERRLIAAAARALAADAVDGQTIAAFFGADEQQISALMTETVRAWRDYLTQLATPRPSHHPRGELSPAEARRTANR